MPSLKAELFEPFSRVGFSLLKVDPANVLDTIHANSEYKMFIEATKVNFQNWLTEFAHEFLVLGIGSKPKLIITKLSEALLANSRELALLDPYSLYQVLMNYWSSVLQDDAFLIASVGWTEAAQLHPVLDAASGVDATSGKTKLRSDLLPARTLIDAYLPQLRDALFAAEAESLSLQGELDALLEEEGGDEGLLNEVVSDKGKVVKKQLITRIKEISSDSEFADELALLTQINVMVEKLDAANIRIKVAKSELNDQLILRYKGLDEAAIKKLAHYKVGKCSK